MLLLNNFASAYAFGFATDKQGYSSEHVCLVPTNHEVWHDCRLYL